MQQLLKKKTFAYFYGLQTLSLVYFVAGILVIWMGNPLSLQLHSLSLRSDVGELVSEICTREPLVTLSKAEQLAGLIRSVTRSLLFLFFLSPLTIPLLFSSLNYSHSYVAIERETNRCGFNSNVYH